MCMDMCIDMCIDMCPIYGRAVDQPCRSPTVGRLHDQTLLRGVGTIDPHSHGAILVIILRNNMTRLIHSRLAEPRLRNSMLAIPDACTPISTCLPCMARASCWNVWLRSTWACIYPSPYTCLYACLLSWAILWMRAESSKGDQSCVVLWFGFGSCRTEGVMCEIELSPTKSPHNSLQD